MEDKTTTLKTKTNDNVYPNVIGDNRDNAISDSPQIKHTLTAEHKINFRLDTNVNNLINNSLQKPAGLTKTKLVGVGTNGQENIEIGDNLTLSNGKLSATGGGSGGGFEYDSVTPNDEFTSYTGTITGDKPVYITTTKGFMTAVIGPSGINNLIAVTETDVFVRYLEYTNGSIVSLSVYIQKKTYNHFITLTLETKSIYLSLNITSESPFTSLEQLSNYLSGKKTLATGLFGDSTDSDFQIPMYVAGESKKLVLYFNLLKTRAIGHKNLDGWAISDLVTPVE